MAHIVLDINENIKFTIYFKSSKYGAQIDNKPKT